MLSSDLTYRVEGYAGKARIRFLHSADGQNDRVTSPLNNHLNSETQTLILMIKNAMVKIFPDTM